MKTFLTTVKGKLIAAALTSALMATIVTSIVFINLGYRTIAVKALNGITQIYNGDKENVAYEGLHLKSGDNVNVNSDADLTLSLDEDKYVYAEPETRFWIEAAGKLDDTRTTIHLEEGSQLFRIDKKLEGEEYFNVQTPNSTMSVRGTVFRVSCRYDEDGELITTVEVFEGEVLTEPVYLHGEKAGEKTGASHIITAKQKAMVRADETISEFVVDNTGEEIGELNVDDYTGLPIGVGEFLGEAIDSGRNICIEKNLLYDYVGIAECVYELRHDEVASTCTEAGHYYPKCSVCGKVEDEMITLPLAEHSIVEEDIPGAVCGESGIRYLKCEDCGATLEKKTLPEKEHIYDDGEVVKEATEKTAGLKKYICTECGEINEVEIPKVDASRGDGINSNADENPESTSKSTNKSPTSGATKPTNKSTTSGTTKPTNKSTTSGTTKPTNKSTTSGTTKPTNKSTTSEPTTSTNKPTTTTTQASTSKSTETQASASTDPCANGHTYKQVDSKDATCAEEGYVLYRCSVCNAENKTNKSKLSHKYVEDSSKYVAPTCTVPGKTVKTCSVCLNAVETAISATGHDKKEDITAATCLRDGKKIVTCPRCDYKDEIVLKALGHSYTLDNTKTVDGTCTEKGSKTYVCSRCKDKDVRETPTNIDNHDYQVVSASGAYDASKNKYYHDIKCKRCGDIRSEACSFSGTTCVDCGAKKNTSTTTNIKSGRAINTIITSSSFTNGNDIESVNRATIIPAGTSTTNIAKTGETPVNIWVDNKGVLNFQSEAEDIVISDAEGLFKGITTLKNADLSFMSLDPSCTSMRRMFYGCTGLTNVDISKLDTSNITNMEGMFLDCSSLTSLDLSGLDTGNVTTMAALCGRCSSLSVINLSGIKTGKVTDMHEMFYGCTNLTSLDVGKFDTRYVTDMHYMFYNCSGLTSLDVSGFDTGRVISMDMMFAGCSGLTSLNVSGFNTRNVENMEAMFSSLKNLTSLDVSGFVTENVSKMGSMFFNCSKLETIYASTAFEVTGAYNETVKKTIAMFDGCTKLKGGNGTTLANSGVSSTFDESTGAYLAWIDGNTVGDPFDTEKTALSLKGKGLFTDKNAAPVTQKGPSINKSALRDYLGDAMDYNIVANDLTFAGDLEASFATKSLHGDTSMSGPRDVNSGCCDYDIIGSYEGLGLKIINRSEEGKVVIYTTETVAKKIDFRPNVSLDYQYDAGQLDGMVDSMLETAENVSTDLYNNTNAYDFTEYVKSDGGNDLIDTTGIGESRFDGSPGTYIFNMAAGDFNTLNLFIKKNTNQIIVFNIPDTNVTMPHYRYSIYDNGVLTVDKYADGYWNGIQDNSIETITFNAPNATTVNFFGPTNGVFLLPNARGWVQNSVAAGWLYTDTATVGGQEWHGLSANKPIPVLMANTTLNLDGSVKLINNTITDSMFSFEITADTSGAPLPENTVVSNSNDYFNFGDIEYSSYDVGKTYVYTIKEQMGSDEKITYSSDIYEVTLEISLNSSRDGLVVSKTIRCNGTQEEKISFTNEYIE